MRKITVAIIAVFAMASALFAHDTTNADSKVFSLCGSIGYGFGMGGEWIDASVKLNGLAVQERSDKYLNYGDGFKLELGGIYKLMENLDAQAVINYNAGVPNIQAITEINSANKTINTYKPSTFGFKTMVLPRVKILDLLDMYAGFGVGLYFASLSWTNSETNFDGNFKTAPALAFCGSVGANYPVYNDLIIYGEIAIEQMSFTVNSILDAGTGDQTNFEQDSNANSGVEHPKKIPGSNIAFRVGAKFPVF
jgi:hypothetical protein